MARVRLLRVARDLLGDLFRWHDMAGMPDYADFVGVFYDWSRDQFVFSVHSGAFAEVPCGECPPDLVLNCCPAGSIDVVASLTALEKDQMTSVVSCCSMPDSGAASRSRDMPCGDEATCVSLLGRPVFATDLRLTGDDGGYLFGPGTPQEIIEELKRVAAEQGMPLVECPDDDHPKPINFREFL